jgi:hypothetical protein
MSNDREQWIREYLREKRIIRKEMQDELLPLLTDFAAALSPPQAVDEKGMLSEAEKCYFSNQQAEIKAFVDGAKWLQSQCPSAPQGDNWISVEIKPKSGERVIVNFLNDNKKARTTIAFFAAKYSVVYMDTDTNEYAEYSEEKDEYYYPEGWHESPVEVEYTAELSKVFGWQPLPPSRSVKGGNN